MDRDQPLFSNFYEQAMHFPAIVLALSNNVTYFQQFSVANTLHRIIISVSYK